MGRPSSYVLLWALLAVRASGRNVDRRQHNEHAEDGVKHDARAVRCPGHDVFPFFQRVCPAVGDIGGRAAPVCDLRHTCALLGAPFRDGEGAASSPARPSRCVPMRRAMRAPMRRIGCQKSGKSVHGGDAGRVRGRDSPRSTEPPTLAASRARKGWATKRRAAPLRFES
jgi:hypothetical protein